MNWARGLVSSRGSKEKCSEGDLNPHALRHAPLKRTCLPFHHPSFLGSEGGKGIATFLAEARVSLPKLKNCQRNSCAPFAGWPFARQILKMPAPMNLRS